jgi:hypothetical protein
MVEKSKFLEYILSLADPMATAVVDSVNNYHRDTAPGRTCLHTLYSSLTAAGVDIFRYHT